MTFADLFTAMAEVAAIVRDVRARDAKPAVLI
jgi:hypothetical protein